MQGNGRWSSGIQPGPVFLFIPTTARHRSVDQQFKRHAANP